MVKLYGIENAENFRDSVLSQRDRMLEKVSEEVAPAPVTAGPGDSSEVVALLREIRDELKRRPL